MTRTKTVEAPAMTVCTQAAAVTSVSPLSPAMQRKPADVSARKPPDGVSSGSSSTGPAAAGSETPETSAMDQMKVATLTRKTAWVSATPSRVAASAGPTKNDMASMVLAVPLAAVSSSGRVASVGSRERWATWNGVLAREARVASTKMGAAGVSRKRQTAAAVTSRALIRSARIISAFRDILSARADVNGAETAIRM